MSRFYLLILLISARIAAGGDWHYGANMVCSDCHTQHNSADGQPMRTDNDPTPAPMLLRRGNALELCLSCHDGSRPDAPDVVTPVGYVSEPAGGAFPNSGGLPTTTAHHLNNPSPEVPPGGTLPHGFVGWSRDAKLRACRNDATGDSIGGRRSGLL